VCQKRKRRCPTLLAIREQAVQEWARAETLEQVRIAWGRLGGRVTLHRYGREHFSELARRRRAPGPSFRTGWKHITCRCLPQ
jgi:hypothetical protein